MKYLVLILLFIPLVSCQNKEFDINPKIYLTADEEEAFKYAIIRYVDRLAPKASHETKFDKQFDSNYQSQAKQVDLLFYYEDKGDIYFAITKIAPSLKLKKVATVGKLTMDKDKIITHYEEIFRTYKMEEEPLKQKTALMFKDVIQKNDIQKYEFKNSKPEEYIEFPDANTYYDTEQRQWISTLENPYESLKKASQNQ
ncbi:hypothetical protein [Confluentibacter citreus]|uniref:hypothetical protein n=1 Tax=Confluentibacter citreus TaxID=2007307 RepID=UPI000C290780|nr:hypothetical protein [Confluentibacter citreus]